MANAIPAFYRILFTVVDPIFCIMGISLHLLTPAKALLGYSPRHKGPATVEEMHMLDTLAGFFLLLGFLQAVLLRLRPNDVTVWRVLQFGTALLDAVMVYAAVRALRIEGRLDPRLWLADDYRNVAANAWIGTTRLLFCLGVGFGKSKVRTKRS